MPDRTVKVSLVAAYSGYVQGMQAAENATKKMSQNSTKALQQQSAAFQTVSRTVGTALLAMGAVAVAGVGMAVKAFMDFSAEMAQVQALSHATAGQMKQLTDAAETVGQKFGYSATQVAEAETELVKAGLSVKDILGGALSGALTIAADGQMDVADATTIAAEAMTQFQLKGKDVPHIADLLAAGADKALGSVGDLGSALESGGLTAHQFGLSLDDTVGTLAAFAQAGIIGERGGTDLRQMLIKLGAPSAEAASTMKQLGIQLYDASGKFVGITDLAGQLHDKLGDVAVSSGKVTAAQKNQALATIFGARAIAGANVLVENGAKGIQNWINKVNDQGFAAEQASKKLDSLSGDVQKLKAAFQTDLIKAGSGANDMLRGLAQTATGLLNGFGQLNPVVQQGVLYVGALVGVIGLAGGAFVLAVPKVVAFNDALKTLEATSPRLATAMGGVSSALKLLPYVGAIALAAQLTGTWIDQAAAALHLNTTVQDLNKSLSNGSASASKGAIDKQLNAWTGVDQLSQLTNSGALFSATKSIESFVGDKFGSVGSADITNRIKTLDSSLSHLVKSGDSKQAAADFDYLKTKTDGSKQALQNLTSLFPQYTKAAKDSKPATDATTASSASAADAYKKASDEVQSLDNDLSNLLDTLNAANKSNQDAISSNAAYQDALANVNDTIKKAKDGTDGYTTSIDQNTKGGADNVAMFADLAQKAQASALAQFQVDGNTKNYIGTLNTQKQALIDTITNMTGNSKAAKDLADKVFAIPSQKTIDIQSTAIQIKNNVQALTDAINALPKSKQIDLYQTTHILTQVDATREQEQHKAAGGLITGAGTGTSDSIPALLSNGEFVVRAAATARNRAMLQYINSGGVARFAQGGLVASNVQRFANGGPVSSSVNVQPAFTVHVQSKNGIDLSQYIDVKIQQDNQRRTLKGRRG